MKVGIMQFIFISTVIIWLITALQCNSLRKRFLMKCPDEAKRYVTPPGYRSPKNVTFLFHEGAVMLLRKNGDLWAQRKHAVILLLVSILWPIVCMVTLGIWLSQL